jgi:hypothetical protein
MPRAEVVTMVVPSVARRYMRVHVALSMAISVTMTMSALCPDRAYERNRCNEQHLPE